MQLEVPQRDDVRDLGIEWTTLEQPWIVAVSVSANDGSVVTLTWDEIASSVQVRWSHGLKDRLVLEREAATRVSDAAR